MKATVAKKLAKRRKFDSVISKIKTAAMDGKFRIEFEYLSKDQAKYLKKLGYKLTERVYINDSYYVQW